jgi:uncharacterized protein (TIGR02147 family)
MKDTSVFEFTDYKKYIKRWIASRPARGHGEKRRFAEALSCNSAYISQVLEKDAHLSLEQAALLSQYLDHNTLECRYFLLLVQKDRAGNRVLRENIETQIKEIIEHRLSIQHHLDQNESLSFESQAIYFSHWQYAAIHVLLYLSEYRTREAISKRFNLTLKRTTEILEFLVKARLARHESGRYFPGSVQVFIPDSSPLSAKSHINWRMRAIASLDQSLPEDLHYTSVAAVHHGDVARIRTVMMRALEEIRSIVKASKNEDTLICYDLDLFKP